MTPARFGACRVLEAIGAGPLTVVFRAEQEPIGRIVAIKALRGTVTPSSQLANRLAREAQILARLAHPSIVSLFEFVRTDDAMWLVLEHVAGCSLQTLLEKSPRGIGAEAAVAIALRVAGALAHAHERGVIHRDVRPSNVLLSRQGEVKLIDFGVAHEDRLPSSPEPLEGTGAFGTPAYMSPEQVLGEPLDARTDVFSLGSVLYEMLSGSRPFDGPDARTTTQRIRHDAPTPLARAAPGTPLALAQIVDRCLEKRADERIGSATALEGALVDAARELELASGAREIAAALHRVGLVDRVEPATSGAPRVNGAGPPPAVTRAAVGYLLVLGAMVAGGSVIQASAQTEGGPPDRGEALELVPERAAAVRVVARPWATVYVDGQLIDVTPFARAIPLRAGEHEIALKHPSAPDERRTVKLTPGETAVVEVEMKVPEPPPRPVPSAPPAPTSSTPLPLRQRALPRALASDVGTRG